MTKQPKVSIIIPLYVINPRFFDDLKRFEKLTYKQYEILVVCDKKVDVSEFKNTRLVLTRKKRTGPAEKRDIAIKQSKGTICAFIDDDAYPDTKWLMNAVKHFQDSTIAAVGGPGITPPDDTYWEQVTGIVYSSFLCGGLARHRFVPAKTSFDVVDYPAYNLLVRKSVLKKVGGYGSHFYGGEDTFLCLKIVQEGLRILYDPHVVVYHHRREFLFPYLRQIANIGKHRGYFAKKYPETSAYFWYFFPAIAAVGFCTLLIVSFVSPLIRTLFASGLAISLILGFVSVITYTDPIKAFFASIGIVATHLAYGLSFIRGLFTPKLHR